jgi:hypothetical protein
VVLQQSLFCTRCDVHTAATMQAPSLLGHDVSADEIRGKPVKLPGPGGPEGGPTVLHMFLFFSVVSLFVHCRSEIEVSHSVLVKKLLGGPPLLGWGWGGRERT